MKLRGFTKFSSLTLLFVLFSSLLGCPQKQVITFPKTFEKVSENFLKDFNSSGSVLQISFAEILTFCPVPLQKEDFDLFTITMHKLESIPLIFYIHENLNIPFPLALFIKDLLEANCSEDHCAIKDKMINYRIHNETKAIQQGYFLQNVKIYSSSGDIYLTNYISPTSQIVSDIRISTTSIDETFSLALSYYYDPVPTIETILIYNGTSCRSRVTIYDEKTRYISIGVLQSGAWNEFSGIISRNDSCKQKPYANLSSAKSQIFLDGKECDFVFLSSSVELLYDRLREMEESGFATGWISTFEKLSERFSIFHNELMLLKLSYLLRDFHSKSFSFALIFKDKNKVEEALSLVEDMRKYTRAISVAFPKNAKIHISDTHYWEVSTQVNSASIYFLDMYFDFLSFILNYIKSLNNSIPQSEKSLILNEFKKKDITLEEKLRFIVLGLKSSPDFLKTSDLEARQKSYEYFQQAITKFLNFPYALRDWRSGLFHYKDGTPVIDTGKKKANFYIPQDREYVNFITSKVEDFLEHRGISEFLRAINSFIKAIYMTAGDMSPKFIYFFLEGLSGKPEYNTYSVNLKKLIFAELRGIIPTWVQNGERYNFAIEWDCPSDFDSSKPMSALYSFPESITCRGILQDMEHFSDYQEFGEAGKWDDNSTGNYFFGRGFGGSDNLKTRFPYIFFKDPSFEESLKVRFLCGGNVGFGFTFSTGYDGVCDVNTLFSFLMSE